MNDIFDDKPTDERPRKVGLAAPKPLTSAELEAKYGSMKHGGIELMWPVRFEDENGKSELNEHDHAALKQLGVSELEYCEVELLRDEYPGLELEDALAAVRAAQHES